VVVRAGQLSPLVLGCALFAALTAWFALAGTWRHYPGYVVATVIVTACLLVAGTGLRSSRRARKVGVFMLLTAALWPTYWAAIGETGAGPFLSLIDGNLIWCVFGTGLLSFPDEQRMGRREHAFVVVLWSFLLVGALALALTSRPEWLGFSAGAWWPSVDATRSGFNVVSTIFGLGGVALAITGGLLLTRRLHAASGLDRAVLRPALAGVTVVVLTAGVTGVVQDSGGTESIYATMAFLQGISLLLVPAVLLVSVVRSRLARAEVADTIMRLTRPSTSDSVRSALRSALRDDSLDVLFWVAEQQGYVDANGHEATPPTAEARFRAPIIGSDDRDLGLITGDLRLREHEDQVESAVTAAGLALENAALHAGLRAQMEQLRSSRARLVEVGQEERRRLERDLHDGAQQHMLAIAMRVEHARNQTTEPDVQHSLGRIKTEMLEALAEIRDLAHGIHPGVLVQAGLGPALLTVTDQMSMPVHIDIPAQRFPQQAESAAYFVACEALTNVAKHSKAKMASVIARQIDGVLTIAISDDGIGAADIQRGSGLRGLTDRVQALGGQLSITSAPETGTCLEARIPCG
jgi:signal transduction histidine kinase